MPGCVDLAGTGAPLITGSSSLFVRDACAACCSYCCRNPNFLHRPEGRSVTHCSAWRSTASQYTPRLLPNPGSDRRAGHGRLVFNPALSRNPFPAAQRAQPGLPLRPTSSRHARRAPFRYRICYSPHAGWLESVRVERHPWACNPRPRLARSCSRHGDAVTAASRESDREESTGRFQRVMSDAEGWLAGSGAYGSDMGADSDGPRRADGPQVSWALKQPITLEPPWVE